MAERTATSLPSRLREGLGVGGAERAQRPVTLAVITGAHGLAGEVRLKLFGEDADALKRYRSFNDATLTLKAVRPDKGGAIALFAELLDRTAAERARGTELTIPRSALPPLEEGEYYHHDLIGLAAITTDGEHLGTVVRVENFGAGDILDIQRDDGRTLMVPFTREAAPEFDDTRVLIDPTHLPT